MLLSLLAPAYAVPLAALLLCDDGGACKDDVAFAESVVGRQPAITPIDLFLVLDAGGWSEGGDQRERLRKALQSAQDALEHKKWSALDAAVDDGLAALTLWPGAVDKDDLFTLYFLQGVSRVARSKAGAEYSFRQAASVGGGVVQNLPTDEARFTRPWLDESRKVLVGGKGWIELQGELGGLDIRVDGEPVQSGLRKVAVLPGSHRLTATRPNAIRTWQVDVPVLAERTSRVTPEFTKEGDATWVRAQLGGALDGLQAPTEVTELLAAWCEQHSVDELELLQVRIEREEHPLAAIEVTEAPATRPAAADGEQLDMGDGVPTTFAEAVVQARADSERAPTDNPRLKIVYFDPRSRQFHTDTVLPELVDHPPEHFRIGAEVGYTSVLGHHHGAFGLGFLGEAGRFGVQLDLGVLRSDTPYNLGPKWVDRQLYHVDVMARWAPLAGRVTPFVAFGPDVYLPVAVGGRAQLGVEARFAPTWVAQLSGSGTAVASKLDVPLGWGVGVGVSRTY